MTTKGSVPQVLLTVRTYILSTVAGALGIALDLQPRGGAILVLYVRTRTRACAYTLEHVTLFWRDPVHDRSVQSRDSESTMEFSSTRRNRREIRIPYKRPLQAER